MSERKLERLIVETIQEAGPLAPSQLLEAILRHDMVAGVDASSAIVRLLSKGQLELTGDRKLQVQELESALIST